MNELEKPAEGVTGHFLYDHGKDKFFFRVYEEDKSFTDYELHADDIKVTIVSRNLSLCKFAKKNLLGWATRKS